ISSRSTRSWTCRTRPARWRSSSYSRRWASGSGTRTSAGNIEEGCNEKMDEQKLLLVVEDVPGIRELLELTLRFRNYEVISAVDGQEALAAIENRRPAAVVTDILMPRMDGFSLLYHLRKDQRMRDIPVVFLSATYVSPEDKDFARTLGAALFSEKPIDIEKFLGTIKEVLEEPPVAPPPF